MRMMACLTISAACLSCSEGSSALGQVSARAECADKDLSCLYSGVDAPLARGASLRLSLDFHLRGTAPLRTVFEAVDPSVVQIDGKTLTGTSAGFTAVLVKSTEGAVLDFFHLYVEEPDGLAIEQLTSEGASVARIESDSRLQLLAGEELWLLVTPQADDTDLAGSFDYGWSEDSNAVALLSTGAPSIVRVRAVEAGVASITVSAGTISRAIEIEVLP